MDTDPTPADLAARCDELEAVVGKMTPGEWRRKKAYGTHVESAVDGGYQDSPTVVTTWSSSFAPPLDESVRNATGIVALRNKALPLIRQLRAMLAAVEGERDELANRAREVTCVWCGHCFESTLKSQAQHLYDHAKTCEKHPIRKAESAAATLRAENGRLRARIDAAMKHLPTDCDLTDTEAEIALELVEPVPLSEQRIAEIVEYATGRAAALTPTENPDAK